MTNNEIKKIVKIYFESITSKDFILFKDILVKISNDNILYGFCFEKSSNKNTLFVWSFCLPLYIPNNFLRLTFGKRLIKSDWLVKENINIIEDMRKLESLMIHEIDNFFDQVDSASKFYSYYEEKKDNIRVHEPLVYSAIYSKNPNSNLILNDIISEMESEKYNISTEWENNILLDMKHLKSILNNEIELKKLFQKNILNTKQVLKIE